MGSGVSSTSRQPQKFSLGSWIPSVQPRPSVNLDSGLAGISGNSEINCEPGIPERNLHVNAGASTPTRNCNMKMSLCVTPSGDEAIEYPYYCPLCMEHFKDVLVAQCCGNYNCLRCVLSYLLVHGAILDANMDINDVLTSLDKRGSGHPLECPHCLQPGYSPVKVILGQKVR